MSLQSETQQLLAKYNISPNKILGQNFLINQGVVDLLLDSAEISNRDVVLEIGSGTGTITKQLARRAKGVIAVEKDTNLIPILNQELKEFNNVQIIGNDILKLKPKIYDLDSGTYKILGAPPYYLTNRLFRKFLQEEQKKPDTIAVIIPKQIAQRVVAQSPHSNLLAVSVQLYGKPKTIKNVPRSCFWPQPKIDSAILVIKNIKPPQINEEKFFAIIRTGFSSPRKKLITNLSKKLKQSRAQLENTFKKTNLDPSVRAESLTMEKWKELVFNITHY